MTLSKTKKEKLFFLVSALTHDTIAVHQQKIMMFDYKYKTKLRVKYYTHMPCEYLGNVKYRHLQA